MLPAPAPYDVTPVLGIVAHTVHYALVLGGTVVVVVLLVSSRPGAARRGRPVVGEHARRVAALRAAADAGRLGEPFAATPSPVEPAGPVAPGAAVGTAVPVALVASTAAAGVHAAALPAHVSAGAAVALFFLLAALGQVAWSAALLLVGPVEPLRRVALVGNGGVVLLWTLSRSVGLPGLGREPVGAWDLAATVWELVVVAACSWWVADRSRSLAPTGRDVRRLSGWTHSAQVWAGVSVMALLLLGTGPAIS